MTTKLNPQICSEGTGNPKKDDVRKRRPIGRFRRVLEIRKIDDFQKDGAFEHFGGTRISRISQKKHVIPEKRDIRNCRGYRGGPESRQVMIFEKKKREGIFEKFGSTRKSRKIMRSGQKWNIRKCRPRIRNHINAPIRSHINAHIRSHITVHIKNHVENIFETIQDQSKAYQNPSRS